MRSGGPREAPLHGSPGHERKPVLASNRIIRPERLPFSLKGNAGKTTRRLDPKVLFDAFYYIVVDSAT
jgi:hypothetical protein